VVESTGLENRRGRESSVGSNPTLSANRSTDPSPEPSPKNQESRVFMPDPRIYAFRPPRTPLGRALFFVGVVALVVASFFVGIFILAVGLGIAVVMMLVRTVRRRVGDPPAESGPNTFEGEVIVVEKRDPADENMEGRDGDR
jgi:hypothetical protein